MQRGGHYGVLSQTIASSPCIKTILSARIRSPSLNDVVMIGYSSIHLREFVQEGHLSNVLADLELGVQILAANVISAEQHVLSTEDAILENGKDEIRYTIRGQPCDDAHPAQIVVLSVASNELVFIYARDLPTGDVQLVQARRRIYGTRRSPSKYGRHIAVDSESRAIAVGANKGSFCIMSLKNIDHIKDDIDKWDPRDPASMQPIHEQRFVAVDGNIVRMDFLSSSPLDPHHIVLLMIVANKSTSRLLLYSWDCQQPLTTITPLKCSGQPLPSEDAFPHLLIPSCRRTSFAIVTGSKIVFYDDVNSRCLKRSSVDLPSNEDGKQWVQFAKPVRHEAHKKKKEDILLIREDGKLRTTVVTHDAGRTSISFQPGELQINVDTAVCALSAPPTMGGDILIACGSTTDGGVFHLAARTQPRLLQSISNWSPVSSMIHLDIKSPAITAGEQGTVLITTGVHKGRSFLSELRHGLEAQIATQIPFEEASSIDRLWTLLRQVDNQYIILASHSEHTSILCYENESGEISLADSTTHPTLCHDQPTLAAGTTPDGTLVQITQHGVHLLPPVPEAEFGTSMIEDGDFLCADLVENGIFAVVKRSDDAFEIMGGAVTKNDGNDVLTKTLKNTIFKSIPVDLQLVQMAQSTLCITLDQADSITVYNLDPESGFQVAGSWYLPDLDYDLKGCCTLSALPANRSKSVLLICGTKTGSLGLFHIENDSSPFATPELKLLSSQPIGITTVTARRESATWKSDERSAYITCGSRAWQLRLYGNKHGLDYTLNALIFTDVTKPSYLPDRVNALDRLGDLSCPGEHNLAGSLICAATDELLVLRLGQVKTMPRQIQAIPAAKYLVYSRHLHRCIAATDREKCLSTDSPESDRPSLLLVDPSTSAQTSSPASRTRLYFGEKGEQMRFLLHWRPTDRETHYDMIMIGTDLQGTGRLSYMNTTRLTQAKPGGSPKVILKFPNKSMNTICEYGESSLVFCADRELILLKFHMETKKFELQGRFELPSRATELRSKGSVIYVATRNHSFMLVKENDGEFRQIGSDSWAGVAKNIIPYGTSSTLVNLVSDEGSRLLNFAERPVGGTSPTFMAKTPHMIDWLVQMNIPGSSDNRERFLGSTIDGTVYMFTILDQAEVQLLNFLEQLCESGEYQTTEASVLAHSLVQRFSSKLEGKGIATPDPNSTHARGDMLRALLQPGPYNLRDLLQKRVKLEDTDRMIKQEDEIEILAEIAHPVIGKTNDVLDGVTAWLRRLLNVPSF